MADNSAIAWQPSSEVVEGSRLYRFMRAHRCATFEDLFRRSVEETEWFWDAIVKDLGLEWYEPYTKVLDSSQGIAWTKWFLDGRFNLVHNCLDRYVGGESRHRVACIWEGEEGASRKVTFQELYQDTNRLAHGLRSLGIGKGDVVGIFMPMVPETVVAALACSKIGAIYVPIFSGFAAAAVASRLQDCEAKLLITADGFLRRGKTVPMKETADEAVRMSPSVKHVIVYPRLGMQIPWAGGRDIAWRDFVEGARKEFQTERTFAEDPFMIIYTSGTTGRPKGTVHVHCGFPIKAAQDMAHCFDLRKNDTIFWLTDLGWMMGPWEIIGCLLLGGRMLLYDGAIDYPAPDRLWQLVERHRASVLGISPTAIRALMRTGEEWVRKHDLSSLRILGSTGEPWNPEPWFWYFRNVGGGRCPIINYSGGTEISGGIVGCSPIQPLKPCSFASPIPGMDADVVDGQGRSVRGEVGELVIRKPWPGMTRGFWKDPQKYLDTYWSRFPGVWVHGDWVSVDKDGMWFIHGRSDDTIKVSGKRVGPAEVESALVSHPSVSEAAAIGVPHDLKGEEVVCFVVLQIGSFPSDPLREELKDHVTGRLGKALRPEEVKFIDELPKTRNAKIMRRVLRGRYLGASDLGDLSSMENPAALEAIDRAI